MKRVRLIIDSARRAKSPSLDVDVGTSSAAGGIVPQLGNPTQSLPVPPAQSSRECEICAAGEDEGRFMEANMSPGCAHPTPTIHVSCLKSYVESRRDDLLARRPVECIEPACPETVPGGVILQQHMLGVSTTETAPTDGFLCFSCPGYVVGVPAGDAHPCHLCGVLYCLDCRTQYHWNSVCPVASTTTEPSRERKQTLDDLLEQMAEEDMDVKPCPGPGCGIRIHRYGGCNHMRCECFRPIDPGLRLAKVLSSRLSLSLSVLLGLFATMAPIRMCVDNGEGYKPRHV